MSKVFIKCRTCGADEEITPIDSAFYKRMGWVLPHHCKACRKMRRIEKERTAKTGENYGTQETRTDI
jgi:hypothetical protein